MDYPSASASTSAYQPPADTETPKPPSQYQQPHDTATDSQQLRDRRREKPMLSCTFCRSRKVRCDRQLPCKTCTSRGKGSSCTYGAGARRNIKSEVSVSDRIQQLETLVYSLVQQQQQQQQQTPQMSAVHPDADGLFTDSSTPFFRGTPGPGPGPGVSPQSESAAASSPSRDRDRDRDRDQDQDRAVSSPPSEYGSMRRNSHGATYVGSVHWAAILDSISELRNHYEEEEEARLLATSDDVLRTSPNPRLLYEPVQATKADLLAAIPARPVVDRMVARYFNARGVVPEILHSGHFLREYEKFWQEPGAASFVWIALLFSVMCMSTQYQQFADDPADPETQVRVHVFREHTIHCLVLGQYTKGGDYVLETLINYLISEMFLSNDAEIGLWLVQGILVQLALSLGYHRDPQNFSNISQFAGEMRRRVWAVIVQIDLRLSSQMALPRLLKLQQYDTAEPRNLLDTDFDETTVKMAPSRPETEVTPVLYSLARSRIDRMNGLVSDLVNDTRQHPYAEIMELDRKLQDAEASLPPIFRWQPLSQSFMVLPQIVMHRVLLQLSIQRQIIWLHRKYLAPSYTQTHYEYSRNTCVQAAIKTLEFHQVVEEETQRDGLLYPVRWIFMSSRLQAVFLLGTSILCYYVQLAKTRTEVSMDQDTGARINNLLRNTYPLWLRSSSVSREARLAVEHLSVLLGLQGQQDAGASLAATSTAATSLFPTPQDAAMSLDQLPWDAYEVFGAECICPNVPESFTGVNASMRDLMLPNTTELDGWMDGQGKGALP